MDFDLTDEQRQVRDEVRRFAENEIRPNATEYDTEEKYPREIVEQAAEIGLTGANIPIEYGGVGYDTLTNAIIAEELFAADPGIGLCIQSTAFGADALVGFGTEEQKEAFLEPVATGDAIMGAAISEPDVGSDVSSVSTRAEKDGDEWVINGNKTWITNGSVADVAVVMTKTDPDADNPHRGITAFLVPTDTEGFEPTKISNKLGIRASDLAEIQLNDVRVPEANVIGEVNRGFYQLMDFFASGRTGVASQAVGVAQAAIDAAADYADEREQGGKPIKEYQGVSHKIADMAANTEAARSLTYRAASAVESGNDQLATRFASMAKLFASENAVDVADDAIQVFGGAGYVSDHPVERYYRDARITKIYEGTSEIQRNIISDQVI